jgi:hypothetical protein
MRVRSQVLLMALLLVVSMGSGDGSGDRSGDAVSMFGLGTARYDMKRRSVSHDAARSITIGRKAAQLSLGFQDWCNSRSANPPSPKANRVELTHSTPAL